MAYANPFSNTPSGQPTEDELFYYQNVPQAGWWRQLYDWSPQYWGDATNRDRYAQNQMGRYQDVFNVAASQDPNLQWYDWLKGQKDPGMSYDVQGPDQRGEQNYRSFTPRARWNMGGY
jgi:hypothetical protein